MSAHALSVFQPLLALSHPERLGAGSVLLRRGDATDSALYLETGRIIFGISGAAAGKDPWLEHQLGQMQGPGWVDPSAAVLGLPSAMDVIAQTEVVLRQVPRAHLQAALAASRVLSRSMLCGVARAHRDQTELAVSRLSKGAEARCAQWLLEHAEANDKGACSVHLEQRKRLIAAQLGIAPETLSRALRHLRERSLISGSGRTVHLVDPGGLRSLAGV
jgi:CRP-like cAMP-binding protein